MTSLECQFMLTQEASFEEKQLCRKMTERYGGTLSTWTPVQFKQLFDDQRKEYAMMNKKQGPFRGCFFEGLGPCIAKHPSGAVGFFTTFKDELSLSICKHGNAVDGVMMCYDAIFTSDAMLARDPEVQEILAAVAKKSWPYSGNGTLCTDENKVAIAKRFISACQ
jgi:hypothetical protein